MAAALARSFKWTTRRRTRAPGRPRAGCKAGEATHGDDQARRSRLLARATTFVVTALVVLGLGALVVAEYTLLWHLLFVPWLDTIPRDLR